MQLPSLSQMVAPQGSFLRWRGGVITSRFLFAIGRAASAGRASGAGGGGAGTGGGATGAGDATGGGGGGGDGACRD